MGKLLHWFYCLPMGHAAVLIGLAAVVFHWMKLRWEKFRLFTLITAVFFAAWLGAMVYTTLGNRAPGNLNVISLVPFHSYREVLAGGNIEILRSNFMNAALFFPGGVLLGALMPRRWPVWGKILLGSLLLTLLSAGVEYTQYAHALGRVEIDDVLHNVCGAALGLAAGSVKNRK